MKTRNSLPSWLTLTTQTQLIWVVTLWLMLTGNHALFSHLVQVFPFNSHAGFMISLGLFFTLSTGLWLLLISHGKAARWVLALTVLTSAWAAFYMDEFGVIIDNVMLDNAAKTDLREVMGLLSWGFFIKLVVLGIVPAWLCWRQTPATCFVAEPFKRLAQHIGIVLLAMALLVLPFTQQYTTLVREHKMVRMYANPTFFHYSVIKWTTKKLFTRRITGLQKTVPDAHFVGTRTPHTLMVMVVGETARFDRFSLNGYHRLTNPRLSQEQVLSLQNVTSCGTSTGVSVPCMFSILTRKQYDEEKALHMENALDVLSAHGVEVLWRDNNSDSKGVALRVPYEDFKSQAFNPVCESNECRDIGMLSGLESWIAKHPDRDLLVVLHQMGNHGPEYYRRVPNSFKKFTPICQAGRLQACNQQEIDNAYDNAILYTDYFLAEIIHFLKRYNQTHKTAMFYVSDHGESLGEKGIYLHAAPYAIAPKEQTHVPAIIWVGQQFDYSFQQLQPYANAELSHDDVFCGLLYSFSLRAQACEAMTHHLLTPNEVE